MEYIFLIYVNTCLLYTSDAADDSLRVDLGGRRIIKKKLWKRAPSSTEGEKLSGKKTEG